MQLITNKVPENILGNDTLFCKGGSFTLTTYPAYDQYFWQDGTTDSVFVVQDTGKYWVMVFDTLGCSGTDSINLAYFPVVTLELQSSGYLDDDSVVLMAVSNYNNYLWQDGSLSQTCIARDSGTYWVKTGSPCETKSDTIVIDACSSIWIPNVFTPNNDGFNDYFYAIGKNIPKFKMEIINRWGQTLKVLHSIEEKWDGTYRGQKAAEGTYFWEADYEQVNRNGSTEHIRLQGSVTLVR
jgi:gliding motility-associated-like protein